MSGFKDKICRVNSLLTAMYGKKAAKASSDPLDTLIKTILSQNTTDKNSIPAFWALKKKFVRWEKARTAKASEIAAIVRPAGLYRQKASNILSALNAIHRAFGKTNLNALKSMRPENAAAFLSALKGVGPKTVACVMLFSLKAPYFPVDTHILRVSKRLRIIKEKVNARDAHEFFKSVTPRDLMYELHINMIEHGRRACRARNPKCEKCNLKKMCLWFKGR
jgi:endonuclease-3